MGHHAILEFVEKKTVEGDVIAAAYDGAIEIDSFSFDVSNKEDALLKSAERLEGATVGGVSISKKVDAASPKILAMACQSKDLGDCEISFLRPKNDLGSTTGLEEYLKFKLVTTSVENYSISGGSGYPTENITLQFTTIKWNVKKGKAWAGEGSYSRPDTKTEGGV